MKKNYDGNFIILGILKRLKPFVALLVAMLVMVLFMPVQVLAYVQSQTTVETTLGIDDRAYKKGEKVSVYYSLNNYNEDFEAVITTMIVGLRYDASVLSHDTSGFKKIAQDNGGLGFSHLEATDGKVTYQYLNISEPLKKDTKELFCVTFVATEDIKDIENVLSVENVVMQDGSKAESVRYNVTTSYEISDKASDVVENESVGDKVYGADGELIGKDKYESETFESELESYVQHVKDELGVTEAYMEDNKTESSSENESVSNSDDANKELVVIIVLVVGIGLLCGGLLCAKSIK